MILSKTAKRGPEEGRREKLAGFLVEENDDEEARRGINIYRAPRHRDSAPDLFHSFLSFFLSRNLATICATLQEYKSSSSSSSSSVCVCVYDSLHTAAGKKQRNGRDPLKLNVRKIDRPVLHVTALVYVRARFSGVEKKKQISRDAT